MSVDLTIYKTGNNVDTANRASINIKIIMRKPRRPDLTEL